MTVTIMLIWFQQDGAACHTAETSLEVLRFDTDLTHLWGAVKDECYADNPETIEALKDNIREAIGEIQLHTKIFQKKERYLAGPIRSI